MRFLVYLLLLANLGMAAWITLQPAQSPPKYVAIPVPPGISPVVLLSERRAETPAQAASPLESGSEDGEAIPATEAEADVVSPSLAVAENAASLADTQTAGQPESPAEPEPEPVCRTVGPLLKQSDAASIAERLKGVGYDVSLRVGEAREPSGYWVYMPAMPAGEARRIVAKLDAKGMKDYFIGKQNYISLGIFSRKDKAQSRLDQIKALGFKAVLDQRYRTRNVFWLDLEDARQPLLESAAWQEIQQEHVDIRVQRVSCE